MVRWLLISLVSLVLTVAMPVVLQPPFGVASTPLESARATPQASLRLGLTHYEAEQFQEAIQQWQQAEHGFVAQSDRFGQALTLSYLSLAHQQLGNFAQAQQNLEVGLQLLEPVDESRYSPEQAVIYAKVLNVQGKLHWLEGNLEAALGVWQASEQAYRQANDAAGQAIAQINQAKVLQYLGLNSQAQAILRQVYQQIQQQPDVELKVAGLRHLSSVLQRVGDLETARELLQDGLSIATQPDSTSLIFLELGNTEWALANRLTAIGQLSDAHYS